MNCPVCGFSNIATFAKLKKNQNLFEMLICKNCIVIINQSAYLNLSKSNHQASQYTEVYHINDDNRSMILENIKGAEGLARSLFGNLSDGKQKKLCDFGTGLGALALASTDYFDFVCGVDYDLSGPNELVSHFPKPNLMFCNDLSQTKLNFDNFILWHVLEHLDRPIEVLKQIHSKLNLFGKMVIQVPMYVREYFENAHYLFYNEYSLKILMNNAGFQIDDIKIDHERQFLTAFVSKQIL
jgi:2-polyprenyl-3-methyl-5-hydroxy-6-metoxy-1,4-benzoquinol methylase